MLLRIHGVPFGVDDRERPGFADARINHAGVVVLGFGNGLDERGQCAICHFGDAGFVPLVDHAGASGHTYGGSRTGAPGGHGYRDVAYWTGRAQSDAAPHVLRRAARAERRLERHIAAGTKRLYRSLKRISRRAGPALIVLDGARLEGGAIVLPAARGEAPLRLSLADPSFESSGGWEWTGSVQVVDITDRKGRVTRRTRPGHRTYMARVILRAPAPQAVEPEHIEQVLGVDVGVVVTAYDSSGGTHYMPDEAAATATIKDAQRRRARCSRGSRRHDKRGRRLATMQRRRANRRHNARRHIAKAIVTTPGIRAVAVENLSLRNMLRSAKGTPEQPGTNVRAKSGLNRSLSRAGLSELHSYIEQAGRLRGVAFCPVHAAGT